MCNSRFSGEAIKATGSWLQPLAEQLQRTGQITIVNITSGSDSRVINEEYNGISQYVLPLNRVKGKGQIPDKRFVNAVTRIVDYEDPDLLHIWGTESVWAYVYSTGRIKKKALLDIQGLLGPYSEYYYGGLCMSELMRTIHLKEILMPWRTLFHKKEIFRHRGDIEKYCIRQFGLISVQSEWVKRYIRLLNPEARCVDTKIMLRKEFYNAEPWQYKDAGEGPVIFSSCSAAVPYKGLHILVKAISVLKHKYPYIRLNLAGRIDVGNKLLDGYSIYLHKLINKFELQENVNFLGSLNAGEIIRQLENSNVSVVPSFVETYCLAFAESMIVGTPTVASYAGAMPELAEHGKEALLYNPTDYFTCADYIDKLIYDKELAEKISFSGRKRRLIENDPDKVVANQVSIYQSL